MSDTILDLTNFNPEKTVLGPSNITVAALVTLVAGEAPCCKSKRGVVLVTATGWYGACNSPPEPFVCTGDDRCRNNCSKVAVHAEQKAIIGLATEGQSTVGGEMVHLKVIDSKPVTSGPPSCWQCSKLILAAGISGMWLLHEEGWTRYTAEEFHRKTLETLDML